jgi:hypothetical protein
MTTVAAVTRIRLPPPVLENGPTPSARFEVIMNVGVTRASAASNRIQHLSHAMRSRA